MSIGIQRHYNSMVMLMSLFRPARAVPSGRPITTTITDDDHAAMMHCTVHTASLVTRPQRRGTARRDLVVARPRARGRGPVAVTQ